MKKLKPNILIFIGFLGLLIASWFLIHILAIFGIFLAFMYPLWYLLVPKYNLCLQCRVRKEGDWCQFCNQKVSRTLGEHTTTFRSAVINSSVLFFFSLLSIGIVFAESQVLHTFGFPPPEQTVSFTIPTKSQHAVGEVFPMQLQVNGIVTPVNTIQADISFDPQKLQVVDISTDDSFATIFIQKEINNTAGYARLTGGLPNPGFSGSHGNFGTIYFKGKSAGVVSVKFLPTTLVLANDGSGNNVLKDYGTISYLITPKNTSSNQDNNAGIKVLGASTVNPTQMIFYDQGGVLGESTNAQQPVVSQVSFSSKILNFLGKIDNTILSVWQKIFRR